MPLSDDERQQLDLIAQHFYAEDPKLADTLGLPSASRAFRARSAYGVLLILLGLGTLLAAVISPFWIMGVFAFGMMLAGAVLLHSVWRVRQTAMNFHFPKMIRQPPGSDD